MVDVFAPQILFFITMFVDNAQPAPELIKIPTLVSVLMVLLLMLPQTPVSVDVQILKLGSMEDVLASQVIPGTTMYADSAQKAQRLLLINKLVSVLVIRRSTLQRQIFVLNVVLIHNQMLLELLAFACLAFINLEIHVYLFSNVM